MEEQNLSEILLEKIDCKASPPEFLIHKFRVVPENMNF